MDELVDHDVVAVDRRLSRFCNVAPRQHHRSAVHGLTGELFVVMVHDAVVIDDLAARDDGVFMNHDADEAVVTLEPQLQDRQAGLRRDRNGHRVVDLEAAHAGELLVREEQRAQFAQPGCIFAARQNEERKARERQLP